MSLPAPLLTLLHPLIEDTPHRHQVAEFIVLLVKGGETQKKIEEELAGLIECSDTELSNLVAQIFNTPELLTQANHTSAIENGLSGHHTSPDLAIPENMHEVELDYEEAEEQDYDMRQEQEQEQEQEQDHTADTSPLSSRDKSPNVIMDNGSPHRDVQSYSRTQRPHILTLLGPRKNTQNGHPASGLGLVGISQQAQANRYTQNNHKEDHRAHTAPEAVEKKPIRCKYYPACNAGESCEYIHPTILCSLYPNCPQGDSCLFIHPAPSPIICKFKENCRNPSCTFTHPVSTGPSRSRGAHKSFRSHPYSKPAAEPKPLCTKYPNCTDIKCAFRHPIETPCAFGDKCTRANCNYKHSLDRQLPQASSKVMCKFGDACFRADCYFEHGTERATKSNVWVRPNLIAERTFAVPDSEVIENLSGLIQESVEEEMTT